MWQAEIFKELILLKEKSLRNFSFSNYDCCTQMQVKITLHWMMLFGFETRAFTTLFVDEVFME